MKKLILTVCAVLLSISFIQAQENEEIIEKLNIKVKEGVNLDIYVDGKKFDFPMELLNTKRIKSVNILKDAEALKKYNAKNGVVLVVTKKNPIKKVMSHIDLKKGVNKLKVPIIIIDGEKSDQETLKKLSPNEVESIDVYKGAMKKYNAPNGAIIVTTKKGNKK